MAEYTLAQTQAAVRDAGDQLCAEGHRNYAVARGMLIYGLAQIEAISRTPEGASIGNEMMADLRHMIAAADATIRRDVPARSTSGHLKS